MNPIKKLLRSPEHRSGIVLVLMGAVGLIYFYSRFAGGAGYSRRGLIFPQVSAIIILLAGIVMLFERTERVAHNVYSSVKLYSVFLLSGVFLLYLSAVLRIGLMVATMLYSILTIGLLTINPLRNWKTILIPSALAAVVIWLVFDQLAKIFLPNALLF